MKPAFATPILARLAKRLKITINIEPRYGYAAQLVLADGAKRYFRGTNFDLNPLGASEIAKDKAYAAYFMKHLGYRVIPGEAFFSREWCQMIGSRRNIHAAWRYALRLGLPVIIKPNSKSQGAGVCLVYNRAEFFRAAAEIEKKDRVFLVQRFTAGCDYRIVVLDDQVISAYERLPLTVLGDGKSSIKILLKKKQALFKKTGRDTLLKLNDFRIPLHLKRQGLRPSTIPLKGVTVTLLDNRNLSSGGDAVDVTKKIHSTFRRLAIKLTRDMGLRYGGVDLMVQGNIRAPLQNNYQIIEINAAPGIDNYARVGKAQKRIVQDMYLQVLKALIKR